MFEFDMMSDEIRAYHEHVSRRLGHGLKKMCIDSSRLNCRSTVMVLPSHGPKLGEKHLGRSQKCAEQKKHSKHSTIPFRAVSH